MVKVSAYSAGDPGFDPWVGKIPWRRKWQPTPVLLPGESHGQRSLVCYSPWGHKESDTTEKLKFTYICCLQETHLKPRETYRLKVKDWKKIFQGNRAILILDNK